jgi:hypothetical protein
MLFSMEYWIANSFHTMPEIDQDIYLCSFQVKELIQWNPQNRYQILSCDLRSFLPASLLNGVFCGGELRSR